MLGGQDLIEIKMRVYCFTPSAFMNNASSNKHLTNPLNTRCISPKARVMIGTLDGWQYMPGWGIVGP